MSQLWRTVRSRFNSPLAIITLIVVAVLGAIDGINTAYGLGISIPDWVYLLLAAFGITIQPVKPTGTPPGGSSGSGATR